MDANDYFDLARKLAQMRTEAARRSAISRGYYAAFHVAKSLVERLGFNFPKDAAAHDKLYFMLHNTGIKSAQDAATQLSDLRKRRNLADYDFKEKSMQTYQDCQYDLVRVAGVINFCENYSSEPLRSELKKGLSEYVKKTGS
ncbi:MAG: HEPN domain-containing protein [bacterium]